MVVVSELVSGRGKTQSTQTATGGTGSAFSGALHLLSVCLAIGFGVLASDRVAAQALPTGGQIAAGQASISTSGANMVVDQSTQRAVVNWQSFNIGAGAHVHFNQPSSTSSTLNRVLGPDASTILGRITAPGQVIISNGNGVFFGRGSMVDVGSLIATTHSISDERFMAGDLRFERNGATGSVVNEGELRAKLEGYIALIAPEVRNQGLIVARKGTVAMAAGEVVELQLDAANKLANIRVQAGQWKALVDNRGVVEAEGGLVILSAQALHELQGGVVRHSGTISAKSMTEVGGRVILSGDAVHLERGSTIDASGATGGGRIETSGLTVSTEGANVQAGSSQGPNGLWLIKQGLTAITQGVAETLARTLNTGTNVSTVTAGDVVWKADVSLVTSTDQDTQLSIETLDGGDIEMQSDARVESQSGKLDVSMKADGRFDMAVGASITTRGGSARFLANGQMPALLTRKPDEEPEAQGAALEPVSPQTPEPQARIAGTVDVSSAQGQGGIVTVEAEHILLTDSSTLLATGATGGGAVLVGGDWQGGANEQRRVFADPNALHQATTVTMESGALIDASATDNGKGGTVVLWADAHRVGTQTQFAGTILARGGTQAGDGGLVETSGHTLNSESGFVNAGADHGKGGLWLLDPSDSTITQAVADGYRNTLNTGTSVENLVTNGTITWGNGVTLTKSSGGDATLTLRTNGTGGAVRNISFNNNTIVSTSGKLNLIVWVDSQGTWNGSGRIYIGGTTITTNGGHLWMGSAVQASNLWNGLAVGSGEAYTWLSNVRAVHIENSTINTAAGSVRIAGLNWFTATGTHGTEDRGVWIDRSTIRSTSGNIDISGTVRGRYTNGQGLRIASGAAGNTMIETTSGNITLTGEVADQDSGSGTRHALAIAAANANDQTIIRSTTGNITLTGRSTATRHPDSSGVVMSAGASAGVQVVSQSGAITFTGSVTNPASSQFRNGILLSAVDNPNGIRIGFDGTNAYSGNIRFISDSILQRHQNAGSGSLSVQTTGALTFESEGASFSHLRAGDSGTLSFDNDWNFGTSLGSLTIGKTTNTAGITMGSAQTVNGAVSIFGGAVALNANLTSTATTGSGITITAQSITQAAGVSVTTSGGNIAYTASGMATTSNEDMAIRIGGFTGSRSTLNANGGNITLQGSYGSTDTAGGFDSSVWIFGTDIRTSGAGAISITGDASNSTTTTISVFGLNINRDTLIQSESGAIQLTGIGGRASSNSRGFVIDSSGARLLSASGAITIRDQQPSNTIAGYSYSGLYLRPGSASDAHIFLGADGSNVTSSSSSITIQSDRLTFDANGSSTIRANTTGVLTMESIGSSFAGAINTQLWDFGTSLGGLTIGKPTNNVSVLVPYSVTVAGAVSVYGSRLFLAGDLTSSAGGNLLLQGSGDVTLVGNASTTGTFTATAGSANSFLMGMNYSTGVGSTITANGGVTINAGTSHFAGNITTVGTGISVTGNVQVANLSANPATTPVTFNSAGGAISLTGGTISGYSGTLADYALLSLNRGKAATGSGVNISALTTGGNSSLLYRFTNTGNDTFYTPYGVSAVNYLVVGGGGGGGRSLSGSRTGGGGGGGGVANGTYNLSSNSINLAVGAGGEYQAQGADSFLGVILVGGGGVGGGYNDDCCSTNSATVGTGGAGYTAGGGGGGAGFRGTGTRAGGVGTQRSGGNGGSTSSGGWGGAGGGAGGSAVTETAGVGITSEITGTSVMYGSGGRPNSSPLANSGGGGGAQHYGTPKGGDGIVILRHDLANASRTAGSALRVDTGSGALIFSSNVSNINSLTVSSTSDNTLSAVISGTSSLVKQGSGTLTLSGVNTYTGTTTIDGGTLTFGNAGKIYHSASGNVGVIATLSVNTGAVLDVKSWDWSGSLGHLDYVASNIVINGGTVRQSGSSANAAAGTNLSSRQYTIGPGGATFDSATAGVTWTIDRDTRFTQYQLATSGNVTLTGVGDMVFNTWLSGAFSLTKTGTGTVTLGGTNTYSGTTTINAGTLSLGSGGSTGTLGASANYSAGISVATGAMLRINNTSRQIFSGTLTGAGALSKQGSGSLMLTGNNVGYSGAIGVDAGSLGVYSNTALGAGEVTLAASTSLLVGRSVTQVANNISLAGNATVDLDTAVEYLIVGGGGGGGGGTASDHGGGGGGGGGVLAGALDVLNSSVNVTVGGGGTAGTANASRGGTGGVSSFDSVQASGGGGGSSYFAGGSATVAGASGGGGAVSVTTANLAGAVGGTQGNSGGSVGGSGTNWKAGAGGGGAGSAGASVSSSGVQQGGAGGAGLASSITGASIFYGAGGGGGGNTAGLGGSGVGGNGGNFAGGLATAGSTNTGSGGGGGMGTGGSTSTAGAAGGSGIVIVRYLGGSAGTGGAVTSGSGTAAGQTLHTFTATGNGTLSLGAVAPVLSGNITGAGALTVDATGGTVSLTGTNSFGNTTISGGTLKVGNNTNTGSLGTGAVTNNASLVFDRSNDVSIANAISGTGSVIKQQASTVTLTGSNSYSGTTTISAGTLQIGAGSTSGTLGSGAVTNNATLSFNRSDDVTVTNAISGTGALTKLGSNTLTLTANNTYAGTTTINGGTLVLQHDAPNPTSKTFAGTGALRIESVGTTFTSALDTSTWNFGNQLTSLTIGKSTNTANVTLGAMTVAGPIQIYGGSLVINGHLTATNGSILLDADTGSTLNQSTRGIQLGTGVRIKTNTSGNITLLGRSGNGNTNLLHGITAETGASLDAAGDLILTGSSFSAGSWSRGVSLQGATLKAGGSISITGQHSPGATYAVALEAYAGTQSTLTAGTGITLESLNNTVGTVQLGDATSLNGGSGDIVIKAAVIGTITSTSVRNLTTTGSIFLLPDADQTSFGEAVNTQYLNFANAAGLTIGGAGNTAAVTLGRAITVAGPITVHGGNIAISTAVTATGNNVNLHATGNVTQTAAITAAGLGLNGTGNFTLTNTSNNITTLAGGSSTTKLGNVNVVNSGALTIGTVNPTGITSTGTVRVETLSGNLTLAAAIDTTSTSADAVILNAGKDAAAGTSTGGNIIVSGSPTITMGTGGIAKLYTGSVSGSTGLTDFVGDGSGRFRYNTSHGSAGFTTALTAGVNALYRERPSVSGTISTGTMVYGSNSPSFTFTGGSGIVNGDSTSGISITSPLYSTSNQLRVGTYSVTAAGLAALGYNVASVTNGSVTVTAKALDVSGLTAGNKVYDGNTTATLSGTRALTSGAATSADGKFVTNDVVSLTGTAAGAFADANVANNIGIAVSGLSLTGADAGNYTLNGLSLSANITPRPITLTANSVTKVYGNSDPTLGYSVEASSTGRGLVVGDSFSGSVARVAGENVGSYAINQGTVANSNYNITWVANNLTITARPITLTANAVTKVYGDSDPTLGYSVEALGVNRGLVAGDSFSGNVSRAAGSNVGSYAINQGTVANSNYNITWVSDNLSITARPITLTANAATKVYGNADPSLGFTAEALGTSRGLVAGDSFTGSVARVAGEDVGNYAINAGTVANSNYNITWVSNNLSVTARSITLTATAATKVYGESDPTLAATVTAGSLASVAVIDTLADVTDTLTRDAGTNVGNYAIQLGQGTKASNYAITWLGNNLSITPRTVTLSASKVYDGTLGLTGSQLTIGNTVGGETLSFSGATINSRHVADVGKYITALTLGDGSGLASNYQLPTLNTANAPVTITAATLTSSLLNTNVSKVYDGTTNTPSSFVPSFAITGFVSGDSAAVLQSTGAAYNSANVVGATQIALTGLTIDSITGTAGSRTSDYVLDATTKTVAATITPASLTVRANDDAKFVTSSDPVFTASYAGFVNGESTSNLSGSLNLSRATPGTNTAGTYENEIVASGWQSSNYNIQYVRGKLTIVPSNQLLVRVSNVNNTYGTATDYSVTSVEYYNGAQVVRLDNASVPNASVTNTNNAVVVADGSGAQASFTLAPIGASTSTTNLVNVGAYQIGISGTVTENSANFSDTITVVGSHQINTKGVSVNLASSVEKVYDGNTSMANVSLDLTGRVVSGNLSDDVGVSGVGEYSAANAGTQLNYSISQLALSGADASNYYLIGGNQISGNNGVITPKAVTLTAPVVSKTYDGNTSYTLTAADLAAITNSGDLVSGESITAATVTFDTRHVGTGNKTVSLNAVTASSSNSNYTFTLNQNSTSTITQLASATWVGSDGDNWSDASKWAVTGNLSQTGVLADGGNVALAIIPSSFTGTVVADSAHGHQGKIDIRGGTLSVSSDSHLGAPPVSLISDAITLNGGTLLATDSFTLNSQRGIVLVGSGTVDVASGKALSFGGSITGTGDLIKTGLGNFNLLAANSFVGNTSVSVGTVGLGHNQALSTGTVTLANGSGLRFNASVSTLANDMSIAGTVDLGLDSLTPNTVATTLSGVISGSGSLDIDATDGEVLLAGENTYSGGTTISGGDVHMGAGGTTGQLGTGDVVNNGRLVFNRSNDFTFARAISGTGSIVKRLPNTVTLTGNNTHSGIISISNGTLQVGAGGAVGTLGTGNVDNDGALIFNRSDDVTVANTISGSGSLSKLGNNTLTLTANSSYSGSTAIAGGALVLSNNAPTTSTSGFSGPGSLRIEPTGDNFSAAFSTNGWVFASTLTGLTIGKASNADGTQDADVTLASAITLNGPLAVFGKNIVVSANIDTSASNVGHVSLTASGKTTLGNITVGGNFNSITRGVGVLGGVTQSSGTALSVRGTATFTANTGTLQTAAINNAGNAFDGVVSFVGTNGGSWDGVAVADGDDGLTLGDVQTSGDLSVSSTDGAITQAANTTIAADDTTTLVATQTVNGQVQAQDITLDGNNDFGGTVNATGADITLVDATGGLELGNITASGTLEASSTDGAITQAANTTIAADDTTTLVATQTVNGQVQAQDITLDGNNDFGGTVNATGADITLVDANNGLALGNVQASGDLSVTSTDGDVVQANGATLIAGGATTVVASDGNSPANNFDVVLGNIGNTFTGAVSVAADDVTLNSAGALSAAITASGDAALTSVGNLSVSGSAADLTTTVTGANSTTTLGNTTVSGVLDVNATGNVAQTGNLVVTGTAAITSTAGSVDLSSPTNTFNGAVTVDADDNVDLAATGTLTTTVTAGGNATIDATDDVVAVLDVTGNTTVDTGGALDISGATNNLNITAAEDITQSAALDVGGTAAITSTAGSVDLSSPTNTFNGAVTVDATGAGADVSLAATGALSAQISANDDASIAATGNVTLLGSTSADSLSVRSTSGSISQASGGTIAIGTGTAAFDASTSVSLSGTGNNFGTAGLQIGNPNSVANVTIDSDINILGPINVFGRDVRLDAVLTAGVNSNIVVSATHNFLNLAGANALNVSGTGRWVVYAGSARDNDYGGLDSGNTAVWNANLNTMPVNLVPAGNRYVFDQDPIRTVVLRTTDSSKVYGDAFNVGNSYSITATGIAEAVGAYHGVNETTSVTLGDVFTANPVFTSDKATAAALVGTAAINITPGTHRASIYDISYQNTGVLTVTPRAITLAANAASKVYGDQNPASYSARITGGSVATTIGDTLVDVTGTLVREAGENAGQYDVLLGNGSKASNYAISFETNNNAFTIQRANLSATGVRQYTGNTTWLGSDLTVVGVNGETFTATGSGLLSSKHVQSAQSLASVDGLVLAGVGAANLNNYQALTINQTSVSVTPKQLNLRAPDATKTYDANVLYEVTDSDLAGLSAQLSGGDQVTRAEVVFTNPNAGSNKTVQINSFSIDDGNSGNNYTITRTNSTNGLINRAPLRITAVNDADFVTLADSRSNQAQSWDNYAGVIYTGLVGGEAPSVLNRGTVTRSNPADLSARSYEDVLVPSGFSSNNYNISYEAGDYTIVAANTLLVRVSPTSTAYGTAPTYALTAQYLANDNSTIRTLTPTRDGQFVVDDAAGSVVRFDIAAENPTFSSANQLVAGGYNLNHNGLQVSSVSNGNFNNLLLVGSLSVTPKVLNSDLGVDRIEKVYDGTNSIANLNLTFDKATASVLAADAVNLLGVGTFGDRHVGVGKAVNISLALRGADATNYALASNNFTDPVGVITQLDSVQWIGAEGANWSIASNWTGGALPDGNNVANILIPTDAVSVYDSDSFGISGSAINNQGVIRFTSANDFVFSNNVSGAGVIEQRGSGLLNVSGFNTLTGTLDIGSGAVVLGHNHALGQGSVVSDSGSLGSASGVTLPRLVVNGDVKTTSAITTVGDQTYNGGVIFNFSGTPTDSNDPSVRLANFTSTNGNLSFTGTVGAGANAKQAQRSLVVSAANGRVTFNDQVGYGVVDPLAPAFRTIGFDAYSNNSASNPWTVNPWAVDVLARTIALNANVTTSETQRYTGATLVGDNGRNGLTRLLVSLDPSITFDGTVDDTAKGQHSLVLRAIALNGNETPSIQLGDVGLTTPLASLDVLAGLQSMQNNSLVAEISTNRSTFIGNLTLEGSVKTVGNQTYVANAIALGSANNPIVLNTEKGTIEAITGQRGGTSTPIQGLDNTRFERGPRAPGVGANLRANASEQGRALNEKIVGRLPSEESEQFGSGMVQSLKRAIELSRSRPFQLDELQELKKLDNLSAEVRVGDMQIAAEPARATDESQSITSCRESDVLVADNEQCQTTN